MVDGLLQVVPVISLDEPEGTHQDAVTLVTDEALVRRMEAELGLELAAALARAMVIQAPDVYERAKPLLPAIEATDRHFLDALDEAVSFEVDPPRQPFVGPTLFVLGRQDAVVGYRTALDLAEHFPRATVAVLDRAGHLLPWEQPDLFRALVSDWLDRLEAS